MSALFPADEDIYSDHEEDYDDEDYGDYDGDGDLEMTDDSPGEQRGSQKFTHQELLDLNNRVEKNLKIKWSKIPIFMRKSTHDILFNAALLRYTFIDPDLQLPFYFRNYNTIAKSNFMAEKGVTQHFDITRAIFYYGIDELHCFSRRSHHVRYNIILMAFAWTSGFDTKYCKAGCENFVKAYIKAWIEGLVFEHEMIDTRERDAFFGEWKTGPFDLYFFTDGYAKTMRARLRAHRERFTALGTSPLVSDFLLTLKNGELSDAAFEENGAALAFQWAMSYIADANGTQAVKNKEHAERGGSAGWIEEGSKTLGEVEWDGDLVNAVLEEIDPTLPDPESIKMNKREVDWAGAWITRDQIFRTILKPEEEVGAQSPEVDMMAEMMAKMMST
ncbi:hypothetical protein HBI52_114280 [Parastagonospora nodorum]|nr:hypothetical protein HBH95_032470 [Parastagonospora nodorum]KAH5514100.1 hypothetical protein HBI52_114280 [Parastagonospora nodorum]KAH5725072.1 hypothetical protein HBI20_077480 [Parastagonospora nodorum]